MTVIDHRAEPAPAGAARIVSAIGPAHGPIPPIVARSLDDLAVFAARFDDSVEVYSPDPADEAVLLAPWPGDGTVALLFALDGGGHDDAELVIAGTVVSARLVGPPALDGLCPAHPVRYLVGFALAESALPAGYRLV